MFSFLRHRSLLAIAAAALAGGAQAASAATIDASTLTTQSLVGSNNGVTITFAGQDLHTDASIDALGEMPALFGTFTVTGLSTAHTGNFTGLNELLFTLKINQTSPSTDAGELGGIITGKIRSNSGSLSLVFSEMSEDATHKILRDADGVAVGASLTLLGGQGVTPVTYSVLDSSLVITLPGAGASSFQSALNGGIDYATFAPGVPVPASALSGTALLGMVFVLKARKRLSAL